VLSAEERREVVRMDREGKSQRLIAMRLGLSRRQVAANLASGGLQ
jgi:DNA-binding CsgD family transcriptional regulator